MIAKLSKGAGFRGALDYLTRAGRDEPPGIVIGGNMAAVDPRGLSREFGVGRTLRPDVAKPVFHASLALPPGQSLSDQDWNKAAVTFLREMGLAEDHQFTVIKHVDTDHEHVHVLASRINIRDGSLAREQRGDYRQSHQAAAKAAQAVGLQPVNPAPRPERKATLTRGELAHAQRAGTPHPKLQIAARLDAALTHATTLDQFKAIALDHGVDVRFSSNSGGAYGVSYRLADPAARPDFDAEWLKGSQVGKGYTLPSIRQRLASEATGVNHQSTTKEHEHDSRNLRKPDPRKNRPPPPPRARHCLQKLPQINVVSIGGGRRGEMLLQGNVRRSLEQQRRLRGGALRWAGQGHRGWLTTTQRHEGGVDVVRWRSGTVAATASDQAIHWRTGSAAESQIVAALAAERGWKAIEMADRGSEEKNRAAIAAYHANGIEVLLNGRHIPAPSGANADRDDARGAAASRGLDTAPTHPVGASAGRTGEVAGGDGGATAEARSSAPNRPAADAAAAIAPVATDRRAAELHLEDRPNHDGHKALDSTTTEEKIMVDSLDFLNENNELNEAETKATDEHQRLADLYNNELNEAEGRQMREDEEAGLARAAAEALTAATSRAAYRDLLQRARHAPDEVSTRQGLLDQAEQLLARADELRLAADQLQLAIDAARTSNPDHYSYDSDPISPLYPQEFKDLEELYELERVHRIESRDCQRRAAISIPTAVDQNAALQRALDREFTSRHWQRAEAVGRELEGRRQQLEWNQMQTWSRRLVATVRGEVALLRGEIQRLEQAHKQAQARERAMLQHLKADPISSSLIKEEAEALSAQRAAIREDAERILAAREAQAEAQREGALLREREAQRQAEKDLNDESLRTAKKASNGAPKPR